MISRAPLGAVFTPLGGDAGQPRRCSVQGYYPRAGLGNERLLVCAGIPSPGRAPLGLFALAPCALGQRDPLRQEFAATLLGCSQHRLQPLNSFPSLGCCWEMKRNRGGLGRRFSRPGRPYPHRPPLLALVSPHLPLTPTVFSSACLPPPSPSELRKSLHCIYMVPMKRLIISPVFYKFYKGSLSHPDFISEETEVQRQRVLVEGRKVTWQKHALRPRAPFLVCQQQTRGPRLEDWRGQARVKGPRERSFTDKASDQNLQRGGDLLKVSRLKKWQNQLPHRVSRARGPGLFLSSLFISSLWSYSRLDTGRVRFPQFT